MKSTLTEAQKQEIFLKYLEPNIKLREISKEYGIRPSYVSKVAFALGAAPRQPKKTYQRKKKITKICPKCKKQIDIKGASFCCFCGADIRSPRELLIARICSAMGKVRFLPEDARDEIQKLLIDLKEELSKEVQ